MDLYSIRKQLNMGISITSLSLRVTDYARVSTLHLEQQKSLQNQVEHFEQYIRSNQNWIYVKGYVDDGITGTSDIKRENFMRMIEDAKEGKFDLIITKEISRFSRNTLDSIRYTRLLLSYGVAVFFVNDNINTAMPDSELRLTIMASMAQDEIRRLSERVKFGMNRAIERGEILGNDRLYGYSKDKDTGNLKIVGEQADVVRRIYEMYALKKLSLSMISKILNEEGLKTSQGNKWCISTLSRMIENPKYKGYYCGRKTEVVDYMTKKVKYYDIDDWVIYQDNERIPPIVGEDLWERANDRLVDRKSNFKERKYNKSIYENRYLYSAKIFCKNHGTVFHRRLFRRNGQDVTWICSEYLRSGKKKCDSPNIRESELNTIIYDLIDKLGVDLMEVVSILSCYYKDDKVRKSIDDEIKDLSKKRDKIKLRKDRLLELFMDGSLSNEEFKEKNDKYNNIINNINTEEKVLFSKIDEKNNNNNCIWELEDYMKDMINSDKIKEKLVELVLDRIMAFKVKDNEIGLDIYFKDGVRDSYESTLFKNDNYKFKRGYDTSGTKRYEIFYKINCYLII